MKILAAEDSPSIRALIQLCFERAGHEVDLAENGQEAFDLFVSGKYETVILDIQMPVMTGFEAARRIRDWEKQTGRPATPVLALSANTEPADIKKCLEAGCTATLKKPFGREELLAAVTRSLAETPVTADPEFADLIPGFLDNSRREAAAMRDALSRRDYAAVAAGSHKIVGAGTSYGFKPLTETSRLIEAAAKRSDDAAILEHLNALDYYLSRVSVVYG